MLNGKHITPLEKVKLFHDNSKKLLVSKICFWLKIKKHTFKVEVLIGFNNVWFMSWL